MRLLYFYVLFATIYVSFGCHKEAKPTIIKGTVVDRKSGNPIDSARFDIALATQLENNYISEDIDIFFTDSKGKFNHTINSEFDYIAGASTISKPGYVTRMQLNMRKGEENELNISLLPEDAVLKIVVVNLSGDTRPFYFNMTNPVIGADSKQPPYHFTLASNPLNLTKDGVYEELFTLPESKNYVFWDFHILNPITAAAFKDSVSVISNDTIVYKITY